MLQDHFAAHSLTTASLVAVIYDACGVAGTGRVRHHWTSLRIQTDLDIIVEVSQRRHDPPRLDFFEIGRPTRIWQLCHLLSLLLILHTTEATVVRAGTDTGVFIDGAEAGLHDVPQSLLGLLLQHHQLLNVGGGFRALKHDAEGLLDYELELVRVRGAFTDPQLRRLHKVVVYRFLQLAEVLKAALLGRLRRQL